MVERSARLDPEDVGSRSVVDPVFWRRSRLSVCQLESLLFSFGRNLLSSVYIVNWPISIEAVSCKAINSAMLYLDIVMTDTQTFRGKMIERKRILDGFQRLEHSRRSMNGVRGDGNGKMGEPSYTERNNEGHWRVSPPPGVFGCPNGQERVPGRSDDVPALHLPDLNARCSRAYFLRHLLRSTRV